MHSNVAILDPWRLGKARNFWGRRGGKRQLTPTLSRVAATQPQSDSDGKHLLRVPGATCVQFVGACMSKKDCIFQIPGMCSDFILLLLITGVWKKKPEAIAVVPPPLLQAPLPAAEVTSRQFFFFYSRQFKGPVPFPPH